MRKGQSHAAKTREKIQTSMLINRLEEHALGTLVLEPAQVQSIKILLGKSLPDLKQTEHVGEGGEGPVQHKVEVEFVKATDS